MAGFAENWLASRMSERVRVKRIVLFFTVPCCPISGLWLVMKYSVSRLTHFPQPFA
jgi:hypothetical protein